MTTRIKASEIWGQPRLQKVCTRLKLPGKHQEIFITPGAGKQMRWLIGRHGALRDLAVSLRTDERLWEILAEKRVRLGFRAGDGPPLGEEREPSYGKPQPRRPKDFAEERQRRMLPSVDGAPAPSRMSDQLANVKSYWKTQTLQAHHIVEFNNLKSAKVSSKEGSGDLDYYGLPCVLLVAELHQRYVSSLLKETHGWNDEPASLLKEFRTLYRRIYSTPGPWLNPLWQISEVILDAAKRKLRQGG